ncbi:MAG: hypothetical protein WC479_09910 [Candidatus Izemoplasmatales bacterium]
MSSESMGGIIDDEPIGTLCPKCKQGLYYTWLGAAFVKCCNTCNFKDMKSSRQNLRKKQVMIWWDDRRKNDQ